MSYPTSTFLLLGDPVEHSLSPLIHNSAFALLGLPFHYSAHRISDIGGLDVEVLGEVDRGTERLRHVIDRIDGVSLKGVNVTIPHKKAVLPFLDELTPIARQVGAANTVFVRNGLKVGHNTDVEGFLSPLLGLNLEHKEVVILGSGGAARAVMVAAESGLKASRISVVSRNLDSARAACADLHMGEVHEYAELPELLATASLIVNATPVGMWPATDQSPLPPFAKLGTHHTVYDLIYNPEETELLRDARIQWSTTIGGLKMLIAQAAASFKIWTGQEMPVDAVEQAVKAHLKLKKN